MVATRQSLLPGFGSVNETSDIDNQESLLPGFGAVNQTTEAGVAPAGGSVGRGLTDSVLLSRRSLV